MTIPKSKRAVASLPSKPLRGRPRAFDRDAALERAMLIFWHHGYEGTSMPDLTREMGISAQSLYAAFHSKAALYKEAMALYRSSVDYAARALREDDIWTALQRLLFESARQFTRAGAPAGCMLSSHMLQYSGEHEALGHFVKNLRSEALESLTTRLKRAAKEGQLAPGTSVEGLARSVYAIVLGMAVQARDGVSQEELRSLAEVSLFALRRLDSHR